MVTHAIQHFPIVAGKCQLVAAFTGRVLVDQIATVDEHVCGESQVLRVFAGIFGQCDKQQGHRGEALLAVDEQTPADTIRADATFLHPYDRPGEMRSLRDAYQPLQCRPTIAGTAPRPMSICADTPEPRTEANRSISPAGFSCQRPWCFHFPILNVFLRYGTLKTKMLELATIQRNLNTRSRYVTIEKLYWLSLNHSQLDFHRLTSIFCIRLIL